MLVSQVVSSRQQPEQVAGEHGTDASGGAGMLPHAMTAIASTSTKERMSLRRPAAVRWDIPSYGRGGGGGGGMPAPGGGGGGMFMSGGTVFAAV